MKDLVLAKLPELRVPTLQALQSIPIPELQDGAKHELRKRGISLNGGDLTPEVPSRLTSLATMMSEIDASAPTDREDEERYTRLISENTEASLL